MNPWAKRNEMDMWNLRLGRTTQDPAASSTSEGATGVPTTPGRGEKKHFLDSSSESDSSLTSGSTASSSGFSSSSEEETEEQYNAKVAFLAQLGLRKTPAAQPTGRTQPPGQKLQLPVKSEKQEPRQAKKRARPDA